LPARLTAFAALGLALLGLAACGGDEEDAYGEEFPRISQRIASLGEEVGEAIESAGESTDQELADDFDGFARNLGDLRQQLDDLEPPEELAEEQDELVAALGAVRRSLEDIADAAEESDPDAARQATIKLVQRSSDLREARQTLARAVREQE
jgi:hypothetical protein